MTNSICVIDDDDDFSQSSARLMSSIGLRLIRFATGTGFLREMDRHSPGCVIIHLGKPQLEGPHVIDILSRLPSPPSVIALIDGADVPVVVHAARHGVTTFFQKRVVGNSELLDAVQSAMRIHAIQRDNHARLESKKADFASLTIQEREVLRLLLRGDEMTSIARMLNVSRRTVENRRSRLMRKLSVKTFTKLVALAFECGEFPDGRTDTGSDDD